ncbi:protein-arginine deiminase type-4 [Ilyonectria robusta]
MSGCLDPPPGSTDASAPAVAHEESIVGGPASMTNPILAAAKPPSGLVTRQVVALYRGTISSAVLIDSLTLAPTSWGLVIDGVLRRYSR